MQFKHIKACPFSTFRSLHKVAADLVHAGAIELETAPGCGTRFRVWLPLRGGSEPPDAAPEADDSWISSGLVLVADDEDGVPRGLFVLTGDGQLTRIDELEPFPGRVMVLGPNGQQQPGRFSAAGPS